MQTLVKSVEIKRIGTRKLRALNAESVRLGLKWASLKAADPDGAHVITILMIHEHAAGRGPCEDDCDFNEQEGVILALGDHDRRRTCETNIKLTLRTYCDLTGEIMNGDKIDEVT